ncbi:MAG: DUF3383 family protein [Polyangia bacterium]|jgi:hypothetical protein|nr:DUF3383 family protein [Polyangia bacterium]
MSATHDGSQIVNLRTTGSKVLKRDFSTVCLAHVGAKFTGVVSGLYASPKEVTDDTTNLNAACIAAAQHFFNPDSHPSQLMIAEAIYESTGGELATSLTAAFAEHPFYAFAIGSRADDDLVAADAWALANKCLFLGQSSDAGILAGTGICDTLKGTASGRSAIQYRATDTEFGDLTWASEMMSLSPDVGSASWRFQRTTGLAAVDITAAQAALAQADYCNLCLPFGGVAVMGDGVLTDGHPIDTLVSKDWAAARAKEGMIQRQLDMAKLKQKIPYTDEGIAMLGSDLATVLKKGVAVGHFEPGTIKLTLPKKAEIAAADIAARKATLSGSVKILNSIEEVTVELSVLFA